MSDDIDKAAQQWIVALEENPRRVNSVKGRMSAADVESLAAMVRDLLVKETAAAWAAWEGCDARWKESERLRLDATQKVAALEAELDGEKLKVAYLTATLKLKNEALEKADELLLKGRPMGAFGTAIDEWEALRAAYNSARARTKEQKP